MVGGGNTKKSMPHGSMHMGHATATSLLSRRINVSVYLRHMFKSGILKHAASKVPELSRQKKKEQWW